MTYSNHKFMQKIKTRNKYIKEQKMQCWKRNATAMLKNTMHWWGHKNTKHNMCICRNEFSYQQICLSLCFVCILSKYWAWFFAFWNWFHIDLIWILDFAYDLFVVFQASNGKFDMYIRSMWDLPISEKQRTRVIIWDSLRIGLLRLKIILWYSLCFVFGIK